MSDEQAYHDRAKLIFKKANRELVLIGRSYLDIMAAIYVIMQSLHDPPTKDSVGEAVAILSVSIEIQTCKRVLGTQSSINECAQEVCAIVRSA